jgi:hypothetical protein
VKGGVGISNSSGYYQTNSAPSPTQTVTATGSGWTANVETVKVDASYTAQLNYFMVPSSILPPALYQQVHRRHANL